LDSLGYAYHHLAQPAQAITCYQRAIGLRHELGDRDGEADSLVKLGDIQYGAADHDAARHTWQTALSILRELDRPEADAVNAKLHGLTAKDRA